MWIFRTGAPWRDLPERFGPWATVVSRFYRWRKQGLWDRLLAEVQREAGAIGQVEWEVHCVDGTNVRGHQHAAGAKRGRAIRRWAGPGGFGTKIHLRVEGQGKPVAFVLAPGQRHEASVFEELTDQGEVRRCGRGPPRINPRRVCGDKGHSSRRIRAYLRRRGIRYTIPRKTNERRTGPFNRALYRQRNLVERTINRLKQFRRIATRYEKKAGNYLAMLRIGSLLLWS